MKPEFRPLHKVTVSNELVTAHYKLTLLEKRLLLLVISCVDSREPTLTASTPFSITAQQYAECYDIDVETAKDELENAIDKLYEQTLKYNPAPNVFIETRWISSKQKYNKDEHKVVVYFAHDIIPLLSNLVKSFTSFQLKEVLPFNSIYSIRLYEIFIKDLKSSYKKQITKLYSITELREMLCLTDSYTLVGDFLKKVIFRSIEDIDKHTSLSVHCLNAQKQKAYQKVGKRIVGLYVSIQYKDTKKPRETEEDEEAILEKQRQEQIKRNVAIGGLDIYDNCDAIGGKKD